SAMASSCAALRRGRSTVSSPVLVTFLELPSSPRPGACNNKESPGEQIAHFSSSCPVGPLTAPFLRDPCYDGSHAHTRRHRQFVHGWHPRIHALHGNTRAIA